MERMKWNGARFNLRKEREEKRAKKRKRSFGAKDVLFASSSAVISAAAEQKGDTK